MAEPDSIPEKNATVQEEHRADRFQRAGCRAETTLWAALTVCIRSKQPEGVNDEWRGIGDPVI